ncbi:flagellar biosynthesis anti-sigma factor FlgM [Shewanella surugensis]|uniref:Negative regulator of flagellin synthesis n=1 Tax=Shewanella surugensis TaxID=212020 RepID=A0ABT0LIV5_9GAMM|nr:flagellar biosynthesis anti-sigma factor FlgM [Shewanella surugensis]MCL1127623.1 flagellar biosynthesis anti-sigma factor FlgM [Shewanella surugensis]
MAMDIKQVNSNANVITPLSGRKSSESSELNSHTPQRVAASDSVSITSQAQLLQGAQSNLSNLPEIDMQKVDAIKLAISEGRYKVDPQQLANNIANFEQALGQGFSVDNEKE